MATENDSAIVVRLSDFSETSQVATLFSRRCGLLRLMAKGLRRSTRQKFAVGLDLLEMGEISFARARGEVGLGTLAEWVQRELFLGLRRSRASLDAGLYAAELVSRLTQEYDPHPSVFDDLLELLTNLAAPESEPPQVLAVRFQARLLKATGFAPQLRECVQCGAARDASRPAWFSSAAGGLICGNCREKTRECAPLPQPIRKGAGISEAPQAWFGLLDYHLAHIAGAAFASGHVLRASYSDSTG